MTKTLLTDIGHLTTNTGEAQRDAAVLVEEGLITFVGAGADAPNLEGADLVDCGGRAVIPGFVDAHTHLVFAGDRAAEFALRMEGTSYRDIAASGGGILSTVRATRAAPADELYRQARSRLTRMMANGTTTVEIKTGYGLDLVTELKILDVIDRLAADLPIAFKKTFLGAHSIPPEFAAHREGYVQTLLDDMLPTVASRVDYCDVFVEEGVFSVEEARRILARAGEYGLRARVHAEQITHSGGATLAAEMQAASADHLDRATPEDAAMLAAAGVAAVLVPSASHLLRSAHAPARELLNAGCTVALATDCNPGTSFVDNMSFVVGLAVVELGLTVEEAVWAATRGGAMSLGLHDRGVITPGARGDLVILDAPSPTHIPYRPGTDLVWETVVAGRRVPKAGGRISD